MKNSLYIGSVAGSRISIHWSFLILIAWVVFSNFRRGLDTGEIIWAVLFVLAVFACVTFHELGHALAGKRYNIKTRDITLLPIGGVAQMESIPEKPGEELVVALAGPVVNVLIFMLLALVTGGSGLGGDTPDFRVIGPGNFLTALMSVNLWLALFNLIPAFPMDGGRVFRALLAFRMNRVRATRIAARLGQFLAIGFVFVGLYYNPFLILIGMFIFLGAQGEAQQTQTTSLLRGYTVRDALLHEIPEIDSTATVRQAVDRLLQTQNKYFVVKSGAGPNWS